MPDHSDHYYTASPASAHELRTFGFDFGGKTLSFATDAGDFNNVRVDTRTLHQAN